MTCVLNDLTWWISAIEIPVMGALFGLICGLYRENARMGETIAAFKLDVARTYAPGAHVRELEQRLTSHLLRIEAKLDSTALKAEGLSAERRK